MRAAAAVLLELTGMALVVTGAALIWTPAAFIAAGLLLLYVAWVQA